ncbi:MAG: ABC transporter permease [Thermoguttaceae bacterium]|nr:ABC transporter permease [Thermoguttaceae bacterium]
MMIGRFLIRRFLWMIVTLWVVFTVSFFLMRAVPGGPFDRERQLDPQVEANLRARYNLDKPLWYQYLSELAKVAQGDLGYSYRLGDFRVSEIILQGLPISVAVGVVGLGVAIALGLSAGCISAAWRGSAVDVALMILATVGIALPSFVIAAMMIILFVFLIPLFPAAGWGSWYHLILPGFCVGAPYAASIARLARTALLEIMSQDYIRTAYAKGLGKSGVVLRHGMKLALLPVISYLGPAAAGILTGSVVVEKIFCLPGLGVHFVEAATQRDYTLAMGLILTYTVLLFVLNTIVDVCYRLLDPRVEIA